MFAYSLLTLSPVVVLFSVIVATWTLATSYRTQLLEACLETLPVRDGGRMRLLPVQDITSIVVDCGLVFVTAAGGRYSTKYTTIQELEPLLPFPPFQRVHRQAVVNVYHVREVQPLDNATARLRMSCGTDVPVSRSRLPAIRAALRI